MWALFQKTFETFTELLNRNLAAFTPSRFQSLDEMMSALERLRPGRVKKLARRAVSLVNGESIPYNAEGDFIVGYFDFIVGHKRTPKKQQWVNDVLFDIKTGDKLLDPLRVFVTDKEFAKLYVRSTVGEEYNIPTEMVISTIGELDSVAFPPDCVIKPTHLSGQVIVRRAGSDIDLDVMRSWFSMNHYQPSRERNYRHLSPKIIVEPIAFGGRKLVDYKFFCVDGRVKTLFAQEDTLARKEKRRQFYDVDGVPLPYHWGYPRPDSAFALPRNLGAMIEVSEQLSRRFGFVRIDLYSDGSRCLVGEITHCHAGANQPFEPRSSELDFSRLLFSESRP